ncbi:MAG: L,D-transpeptidase family protein [Acidimicrobiia bacterium]
MRRVLLLAAAVSLALVAPACGGGGGGGQAGTAAATRASRAPDSAPADAQPAAPSTRSPVDELFGVGSAEQVISVIADQYDQSTATLTAYERDGTGWEQVFGPWNANIGAKGFAPPDEKREGDDRTPSGAYGFDFAFGVLADPGAKLPFRPVVSSAIVWDDDPASARYNQWVDSSEQSAGNDPEPMYNTPAYNYGAVIDYNAARTPGLGSAIFLHVTKDGPTAGCVAVAQDRLVELLRWIDPARKPRIIMGTRAAVTP